MVLLLGVLLWGCGDSLRPDGTMPVEDYPLTQGSNPTRIISERIFTRFTGLDDTKGDYYKICHTGTSEAYRDFLAEDSDIEMLIAQQPDPETEKAMDAYFFKPIAKDALVFITNIDNPVDSLTLEQVKDILSGAVTNWQQVGGKDEAINFFRRNETGGSQILLDKYVLQGGTLKEVPRDHIANDMRVMSQYVAEKSANGATFGYTTYYFAEYSGRRPDIKTIKINGIQAEYESIKNNTYPIISQIFMGVKEMDTSAGRIYQWISTSDGQALIKDTGYVPL